MMWRLLADLLTLIHAAFVLYVVLGGLLALRWPRSTWLHLPAVLWGGVIEFAGWVCPLTPLENHARLNAGMAGYASGFIDHYLRLLLYPPGLTREVQLALGCGVLLFNGVVYFLIWRRLRLRRVS